MKKILLAVCSGLIMALSIVAESADNDTEQSNPLKDELDKIELEKSIAEAKLAKAKAEKELETFDVLSGETKGKEGTITVGDKGGKLSTILVRRNLPAIAGEIVSRIDEQLESVKGKKFLLAQNISRFNDGISTEQTLIELNILTTRGTKIKPKANKVVKGVNDKLTKEVDPDIKKILGMSEVTEKSLAATTALVVGTLAAAGDIASFFKKNVTVTGLDISVSDEAIAAELVKQLSDKKATVYSLSEIASFGKYSPLKEMRNLITLREELADIDAKLGGLVVALNSRKSLVSTVPKEKRNANWSKVTIVIEDLLTVSNQSKSSTSTFIGSIDNFLNRMISVNDKGESLIKSLVRHRLSASSAFDYILEYEVTAAGDAITSTGVFTSSKLIYASGISISYRIFPGDGSGKWLTSGTVVQISQDKYDGTGKSTMSQSVSDEE
jgi:hypothetical protein